MSDQPKLFVHAGTAKTGTSAVQSAFAEHQKVLEQQGYQYPDLAGKFERAGAGLPTTGNASVLLRLLKEDAVDEALATLKPYQGQHLILSHEAFANIARTNDEAVLRFVEGARALGFDPCALVMFRPQTEFIPSFYLQQIKEDKTSLRLDDYLAEDATSCRLRTRYNWLRYAKPMKEAFGPGLKVMWYPAVMRGQGVIAEAFRWLGLEPLPVQARLVNPSPGAEPLAVLRAANEAGNGGRHFADRFLVEAEKREWLGHKVALGEAEVRRIEEATYPTNERLLRRFCPGLSIEEELAPANVLPAQMDDALVARLEELARALLAEGKRPATAGGWQPRPAGPQRKSAASAAR
jgi:hypothetical protein